jgi:hypothetical protein
MERVLDQLAKGSMHGDVHISAMLRHTSLWQLRADLLHQVIRVVYREILSVDTRHPVKLMVLQGSQKRQKGLVRVQNVLQSCTGYAPLLVPRGKSHNSYGYAVMSYGGLLRPLRAWYAHRVVKYLQQAHYDYRRSNRHNDFGRVSNQIQQSGANREEQSIVMSIRTYAMQLFDIVFDK